MTAEAIYESEETVQASMLNRVAKILERAELISNMNEEDLARNYPTEESRAGLENERQMLVARAAELIAKYKIDRAMLMAAGRVTDGTIDKVVMAMRPFAKQQSQLFAVVARSAGAKLTWIKSWNPMSGPKRRGGIPAGGYDFGYRVFAFESDLLSAEVLYASLLNQMLQGVSRVRDTQTKFGQRQKAMRESWLDGFIYGVQQQIAEADRAARERAEAEAQEAIDRAMADGGAIVTGPSVALVLADRAKALNLAYDAAQGITPEQRAAWTARNEELSAKWREEHEAKQKEIEECRRCQRAKSGRCNEHRVRMGRSRTTSARVGDTMGMWSQGYSEGRRADLGAPTSVSHGERKAI